MNAGPQVLSRLTYLPYDEELTPENLSSEVMRFTVHERDFDPAGWGNDLDYMHSRFYSPRVGGFAALDSARGREEIPQSWNRYAYTLGNPLVAIDPDGQVLDVVLDVGFIAYDLFEIGRGVVTGSGVTTTHEGVAQHLAELKRLASDTRQAPEARQAAEELLRVFSKKLDEAEKVVVDNFRRFQPPPVEGKPPR